MTPVLGLLGLLGLLFGSFANVAIHRAPLGQSIVSPPSACPRCGARIRARHNVPVIGWLWLRGRCADCGLRISGRYPVVEALMAVVFAAIGIAVGFTWLLPTLLVLAFFAVVLGAVDLETRRLPDRLVVPFAVLTIVSVVVLAVGEGDVWILWRALIGAVALGIFYLVAFVTYPRGMGFGDVKLAPVLGAILGSLGWAQLAVGGFAAFVWGSVAGIAAMTLQRRRRGVAIPFGPWMFFGAWTGIIAGPAIADWYLGVVGIT